MLLYGEEASPRGPADRRKMTVWACAPAVCPAKAKLLPRSCGGKERPGFFRSDRTELLLPHTSGSKMDAAAASRDVAAEHSFEKLSGSMYRRMNRRGKQREGLRVASFSMRTGARASRTRAVEPHPPFAGTQRQPWSYTKLSHTSAANFGARSPHHLAMRSLSPTSTPAAPQES